MMQMLLVTSLWGLSAAAPPDDKKDPPPLKLSDDEKTLLDLTNAERAKEKLLPLAANPLLFQAVRAHAANMAKKGEMKHVLDGKGVEQRLSDLQYDYHKCGENIGWSDGDFLAGNHEGLDGLQGAPRTRLIPGLYEDRRRNRAWRQGRHDLDADRPAVPHRF